MATLAIMLLTSMNYALSLGYALTFLAGGLVASALLATFRNLAGLAASPLGAGETFAGGELEFTLSLASGSRRRVGITVAGRQGLPGSVDLPAGATRPIALSIAAPKRGRLGLGRVSVSSDFPLGIWRAWAYVHFPLSGTVYPAMRRLERDSLIRSHWESQSIADAGQRPPRKYYKLTRSGKATLEASHKRYPLLARLIPSPEAENA